ncbi:hypothetical protein Tco_0932054, partial [Tanacetum coccineum]
MSDSGCCGLEHHHGQCWQFILQFIHVELQCHELRDEMVKDMQGTPAATDVVGLSQRMTDFVTTVRQDIDEIYVRLDDAQDERLLMSDQLNMLRRDRRAHAALLDCWRLRPNFLVRLGYSRWMLVIQPVL